MRVAIVSDIHGNRTAFEAVLEDLRETSPDLILHGGDLPHGGASPAEIVDLIRDLGWQGVAGNTDEMLWNPEALTDYASVTPGMQAILPAIQEMAASTRESLGAERIEWLRRLPRLYTQGPLALVHASPESLWAAPAPEAGDEELESIYAPLNKPIAVCAHIHRSYVRVVGAMTVVNAGSVSLSYDGDPRAAYLLLDGFNPTIRRVEYDINREVNALLDSGLPHAEWMVRTLKSATPQML